MIRDPSLDRVPRGTGTTEDPRLGYEIRLLGLTARGQRACRMLGVRTVRDFLARSREDFLHVRNCGNRTYEDIAHRVRELLSAQRPAPRTPGNTQLHRPLRDLIRNPRAERAFQALGLTTAGDFLQTPKEQLLAVKGFGERTYWLVSECVRQCIAATPDATSLVPAALADYEIDALGLPVILARALHNAGATRVGDLLRLPIQGLRDRPAIGDPGIDTIRESLDHLVRVGVDSAAAGHAVIPAPDFTKIMAEVLTVIGESHREFFIQRVGLHGIVRSLRELAGDLGITVDQARELEQATRADLEAKAPAFVAQLRNEARRDLLAHGTMRPNRFRAGTLLHGAATATIDPLLPLRLVRFLGPNEFFLHAGTLSTLPPPVFRRLCEQVRRRCARRKLPVLVTELNQGLEHIVDPVPIAVVLDVIRSRGDLEVCVDATLGEIVRPKGRGTADRLHDILVEAGRPLTLEDILFIYRDLHRTGNMHRLVDYLRRDDRFLEVGRATWSLRTAHADEIYLIESEANAIVDRMLEKGQSRDLLDLATSPAVPERRIYLVIDCMRRDQRVRYLGRGRFSIRGARSPVMEDISESMKRAMGEIVVSRFVDNQPRDRRRLAECLLHDNRALVETGPDRVDSLSNYPFNAERLERLFALVQEELDQNLGYATAADLLDAVCATDLGGGWLTKHMLLDVLRRHGRFELLPGDIVARLDLGLAGWIQRKIRACLRAAAQPLSPAEIVSEAPDIRDFTDCIDELAKLDPMILCYDEERFALL